jgi:Response regulator containing CheY-like receiver domain and AraC-type DNA-binding domain
MENIGVMLVDDEVLAIEYFRNMIPWEEYGFSVVAEALDGKRALERLEKYRPEIVFVDICMPVMDGLEFCKRALGLHIPLIIILVTAYKDFDYARKAIELGVTNYILKHDICAATILNVLKKAKEELEKEKKKKSILRQKYYKDLIYNLNSVDQVENDIPAEIRTENHILLLSQVDMPYQVVEGLGSFSDFFSISGIGITFSELPQFINNIENIDMDERRFVTVVSVKRVYSQLETIYKMLEISRSLQCRFRERYNNSISVAVSDVITSIGKFSTEYGKLQKILELRFFFGKEKIFSFDSYPVKKEPDDESVAEGLKIVKRGLNGKNREEIARGLENLFSAVHLWPNGLRKICRELLFQYDEFSKKHGFEDLEDRLGKIGHDNTLLFDSEGIKSWFLLEFTALIEKSDTKNNNAYSRKTQQAIAYIHRHYNEDMPIEQVAREIDISSVYLMKLFQKEVGETFIEYLTSYRIEIAKKLLSEGRNKVYEISEMVGYKSSQYFSQVFRKLTGLNPLDFKDGEETDEKQH